MRHLSIPYYRTVRTLQGYPEINSETERKRLFWKQISTTMHSIMWNPRMRLHGVTFQISLILILVAIVFSDLTNTSTSCRFLEKITVLVPAPACTRDRNSSHLRPLFSMCWLWGAYAGRWDSWECCTHANVGNVHSLQWYHREAHSYLKSRNRNGKTIVAPLT
jgi:hypothetical protein